MHEEEQSLIEEGKIPLPKNETRTTIVALTPEFKTRLQNYLESRPYAEVHVFVEALRSLHPFEVSYGTN